MPTDLRSFFRSVPKDTEASERSTTLVQPPPSDAVNTSTNATGNDTDFAVEAVDNVETFPDCLNLPDLSQEEAGATTSLSATGNIRTTWPDGSTTYGAQDHMYLLCSIFWTYSFQVSHFKSDSI